MVVLAVDVAHLSYQAKHINDDRGPLITVVNISLMIVAILAVGLRFWSRKLVKATWREDDLAIVLSLVRAPRRGLVDVRGAAVLV